MSSNNRLVLTVIAGFFLIGLSMCAGSAQAQPVPPEGEFILCVFDREGQPISGHEWSVLDNSGEVTFGTTQSDGCAQGIIAAGPASFEAGTGIVKKATVDENISVYVTFTVPPYQTLLPLAAK